MKIKEIKSKAKGMLKNNYYTGIALSFFCILGYLCLSVFSEAIIIFSKDFIIDFKLKSLLVSLISLIVMILFLSPLILGTKNWYFTLNGEIKPMNEAFSFYTNIKIYFNAVFFLLMKSFTLIFICFLIFLPTIILAAFIKIGYDNSNQILSLSYGTLILLFFVFLFLQLMFLIYIALGFFFTDFIYIKGDTKNPFKAMSKSIKVSNGQRGMIIKVILSYIPYFLLCLLIIPIPFVLPKIKIGIACFADSILEKKFESLNNL